MRRCPRLFTGIVVLALALLMACGGATPADQGHEPKGDTATAVRQIETPTTPPELPTSTIAELPTSTSSDSVTTLVLSQPGIVRGFMM